jgi:hypothetical protein
MSKKTPPPAEDQPVEVPPQPLTIDWVLAQRKDLNAELIDLLTPHIPALTDEIIRDLAESINDPNPSVSVEYAWIGERAEELTHVKLRDTYGRHRAWNRLTDLLIPSLEARGFVNRIMWDGDDLFEVHVDELPPEPEEGSDNS